MVIAYYTLVALVALAIVADIVLRAGDSRPRR